MPPSSAFHDGRAVVQDRTAQCYGYLAMDGTYTIPPRFSYAGPFSEGRAAVAEADTFGYIDREGEWVIPPRFGRAEEFRDGRAWVSVDGRWGRIDRAGAFVTAPRFEQKFSTDGRLVHVVEDERVGLYDPIAESLVVEPRFGWVFPSEGTLVRAAMGTVRDVVRWGYLDDTGAWAIPPQFEGAGPFVGDTAFVVLPDTSDVRWGSPYIGGALALIDRTGRVLDRPVLDARRAVVEQPLSLPLPDSLFETSSTREPLLQRWARLLVGPASPKGAIAESAPLAEEGYEGSYAALYPRGVTFFGSHGYESFDDALILPGGDFDEAKRQVEALARRVFRVDVEPEQAGQGVRFVDEEYGYHSIGVWPTETGVVVRSSWGL